MPRHMCAKQCQMNAKREVNTWQKNLCSSDLRAPAWSLFAGSFGCVHFCVELPYTSATEPIKTPKNVIHRLVLPLLLIVVQFRPVRASQELLITLWTIQSLPPPIIALIKQRREVLRVQTPHGNRYGRLQIFVNLQDGSSHRDTLAVQLNLNA